MLRLMGTSYITQHILNELKREAKENAFRIYVTDTLYAISTGHGMTMRYIDLIKEDDDKDTRSAEQIVNDVITKAGITVIDT